jgi:hypothetical protein
MRKLHSIQNICNSPRVVRRFAPHTRGYLLQSLRDFTPGYQTTPVPINHHDPGGIKRWQRGVEGRTATRVGTTPRDDRKTGRARATPPGSMHITHSIARVVRRFAPHTRGYLLQSLRDFHSPRDDRTLMPACLGQQPEPEDLGHEIGNPDKNIRSHVGRVFRPTDDH